VPGPSWIADIPARSSRHHHLDGRKAHVDAFRRRARARVGMEDVHAGVARRIGWRLRAGIGKKQQILVAIQRQVVDVLAREGVVRVG
jgi:hypothetical protein